ncbi:MAG: M48 family metalloprotease [Bryobacteraceae bacterium]|nr:M48 family metalloprotease [Bryobacteraceae bacterium]
MNKVNTALLLILALLVSPSLSYSSSASQDETNNKAEKREKNQKKKKPRQDVEQIGERGVGRGVNFYSVEKEIALGKAFADEIERQAKVVSDPMIAEYVNRVGQNLARHSDSKLPFTFKVLESPEINAFALPGGFCFVNTGLILEAETEAEMAGVLAHEIAHVAARHGTRQATRGQLASLATLPLIIATGGWTGYGISQAANMAIPIAFLQFSRGFEREADFLGLQYLYAAGYDPTAFVDFFEKLASMQKTKPGALAGVFSSHPMTDDRIQDAQKEMDTILPSKPEYVVTTSEFLNVKTRLAQLLDPRRAAAAKSGGPDRPQVRRSGTAVVIKPEGKGKETAGDDDDDNRPVLRRSGGAVEESAETPGEQQQQAPSATGTETPAEQGDRPVLKRGGGTTIQQPAPQSEDEAPPVLKRKK